MADEREVGSEFELAPATLRRALERPRPAPPTLKDARFAASGREALSALLRAAGRPRVVLGAYLCDSLLQATVGFSATLVPVDALLRPRPDALTAAWAQAPEQTTVVAVPIFATPWAREHREAVVAAQEAGVLVIEDRTHTLWDRDREPLAETWIASLRKWMPVPDGGAFGGPGSEGATLAPVGRAFVEERLLAQTRKHDWLQTGDFAKSEFLEPLGSLEADLGRPRTPREASPEALALLGAADIEALSAARRNNYAVLRARLEAADLSVARPLEPPLAAGAVPLGLPIRSDRRDALRRHLITERIYCPVHWPLPTEVTAEAFPTARRLESELLTLVIDQRYHAGDMERIAHAIEAFAARREQR